MTDQDDVSGQYAAHANERTASDSVQNFENWMTTMTSDEIGPATTVSDPLAPQPTSKDLNARPLPAPKPLRRKTDDPLGRIEGERQGLVGATMRSASEIPRQTIGGIDDAARNALSVLNPLTDWLNDHVADLRYEPVDPAKTTTGSVTRKISEFLTGFIPALKGLRAAGLTGQVLPPMAAGAISDFAVRDPHDGRLADIWNEMGLPRNLLTEYMKSDPTDTEIDSRVKNAIEGVAMGSAVEGLMLAARALRASKAVARETKTEIDYLRGKYGEVDESMFKVLGDPSKPSIETVVRQPPAAGGKIGQGFADTVGTDPRALIRGTPRRHAPVPDDFVEASTLRETRGDLHRYVIDTKSASGQSANTVSNVEGGTFYTTSKKSAQAYSEMLGEGGRIETSKLSPNAKVLVLDAYDDAHVDRIFRDAANGPNEPKQGWAKQRELDPGNPEDFMMASEDAAKKWGKDGYDAVLIKNHPDQELYATNGKNVIVLNKPGAPGAPPEDWDVYINFARFDEPNSVKFVIGKMAEKMKGQIDEATRGRITQVETQKMAEEMGLSVTDILARKTGETWNAETALAARQLWAASGEKLLETAKAAAGKNAGPVDQFNFRKMMAIHASIQAEVIGARTESARSLASWAIPAGGVEKARAIESVMNAMGGAEVSSEMARRLAILADSGASPAAIARFAERGYTAATIDAVKTVWINALLSTPTTHAVNVMSNTMVAFQSIYERAAAGAIHSFTGGEGVQAGEAAAMAFGMIESLKDAFRMGAKSLRTGESGLAFNKVDIARPNALSAEAFNISKETGLGRAVDFMGNVTGVPTRLLGAEDEFFKTIGYRMELRAQALRQASQEGLKGPAAAKRIAEILDNPPEFIRINSADAALYNTFTNEVGWFGRAVMNLRQAGDPFNPTVFILPFIKTPVNIARYAFERTPFAPLVGQWRADVAAGGARADLALARMSTGTAIMLTAMDYADSGLCSGAGPKNEDKDVREALMREGWQPYSCKVGNKWYSYNRLDPFGMTMGFAASISEAVKKGEIDEDDVDEWYEVSAMAIAAVSQVTISKTYLQGFAKFVEMMGEPSRHTQKYVDDIIGSFVPGLSNAVKNFVDPVQREANTPVEAVMARIAFLSEKLPARRDLWGRAITNESGFGKGYELLSPIAARTEKDSPIDRELVRLNQGPLRITKKPVFGGVQVNLKQHPDVYDEYTRLAGNELKPPQFGGMGAMDYLNSVVTGKNPMSVVYNTMSDGSRKQFITSTIQDYRKLSQQQILSDPKFKGFAAEHAQLHQIRTDSRMPYLGE